MPPCPTTIGAAGIVLLSESHSAVVPGALASTRIGARTAGVDACRPEAPTFSTAAAVQTGELLCAVARCTPPLSLARRADTSSPGAAATHGVVGRGTMWLTEDSLAQVTASKLDSPAPSTTGVPGKLAHRPESPMTTAGYLVILLPRAGFASTCAGRSPSLGGLAAVATTWGAGPGLDREDGLASVTPGTGGGGGGAGW